MAVAGAQDAEPLWQVRHAGDGFDDGRVAAARDLDHPATFTPAFATKAEWMARAETLRRQVRVALGLWPWPERTPLNAVVRGRIVRDGYTIEHVAFESVPGHWVTGSLYRPTGRTGRLPAVLAPHGHWPGGRHQERSADDAKKEMASGAEQTIESARYPLQARPAMLARMGVIAFAWDMVGYADSTAIEHRAGFTDADAELRLQSFLGLSMWNAVRAVDFLLTLPDVDPARIGINGASGGGTQSLLLAAIDDRVATAVPAVMVSGNMQGGCICENATLMRLGTNNIELTALAAPRPLAAVAANDWTHRLHDEGAAGAEDDLRADGRARRGRRAEVRVPAQRQPGEPRIRVRLVQSRVQARAARAGARAAVRAGAAGAAQGLRRGASASGQRARRGRRPPGDDARRPMPS